MAHMGIAPTTLVLSALCSNKQQLQKVKFNYKYQCVRSMNLHVTVRTSQHPSCMLLFLRILKPRLRGLVETYRCKLCHFTSRIKSKIRIHLAQMRETDTACRISGYPEMNQGKNKLYSFSDEKNENQENLAKNYCHVVCVSDALK